MDHPNKKILQNTLKSFTILLPASLLFGFFLAISPIIASIFSLLISPIMGLASYKLRKKRFWWLLLISIIGCWLTTFVCMVLSNNVAIPSSSRDLGPALLFNLWILVGFSLLSLPILMPAIIILERWTRGVKEIKN